MISSMTSDLYAKVEKVIREHIQEHQSEVRKGKELMSKLDVVRLNQPTQDYSFDLFLKQKDAACLLLLRGQNFQLSLYRCFQ